LNLSHRISEHGFTLLELLIAMSLLVLIVAITMGAMRLASRSVTAGDQRTETQERFRTVMTIMDAQIQSQMPLTYEEDENKAYYFRGDNKNLRLASNYSIWGGRKGSVIVEYRVEADERGKQTLYADEQTPGIEAKRKTRLFTNASEIFFEYFYKKPADEEGKWWEQLTTDDEMIIPEGIRLHVSYGAKKLLCVFPVRVREEIIRLAMTPFSATGGSQR